MLQSSAISSIPESLNVLFNLRTLRLSILKLEDMSWIGCLIHLELLSISTSSLTDIPKEMGQLGNLRLLDLRKMSIAYIPPGVLPRMLKLEELYFPLSFQRWGCRAKELDDALESWGEDDYDGKERTGVSNNQIHRINTSISEITSLPLHTLEISLPCASVMPKNSSIFENIRQFKIVLPNNLRYKSPGKFYSTNVLQLMGDAYDIKGSGICNLMSRTEELSLMKVRNLKNIMLQLHDNGFPMLQKMIISECDELEYVVDTTTKRTLPHDDCLFSNLETLHLSMLPNLKEILHGRLASLQRFENLSQISIRFCHKLKYVFPLSIVRGLIRLKGIQILGCIELDGIFYQDKEGDKDPVLYSIEELHLHALPKLVGFLAHMDDKISEVQDDADQSRTTNKILSSSMEESICTFNINFQSFSTTEQTSRVNESCIDDEEVICPPPITISRGNTEENVSHQPNSSQLASFTMNKDVVGCAEMYAAFISSKLAEKWMQNLKRLEIASCGALQIIFLFEENHVISGAFDSLMELKLFGLQNLEHIWFQVPPEMIAFQNLRLLVLSECHNFYLFSPRVAKLLVQLRKIYINRCEKMEEVIGKEIKEDSEDKIVFPQLQILELEHIPNLKVFYSGIHEVELPLLESLKMNRCNKVEYFSHKLSRTPMMMRIEINGRLCALTGDLNTTIMRNCFGTPTHDDNSCSTFNSYSPNEQDGSEELYCNPDKLDDSHNTPHSYDEFKAYYELLWRNEIELPDSFTTVDISSSKANDDANQCYMKEFTFADMQTATNNFSSDALLGEGSFGHVYKGWLDERTLSPSKTCTRMAVAIKKMKPNTKQRFHEWQAEVYFLERLCHPNLIKLLGYCREDEELLLVYQYMQRSLHDRLFRRNLGIESLSWELRLKIAIGAARGLVFLHTLEKKVIHRDVKASNILLDEDFNSRIADFGLATSGLSDGDLQDTITSEFGLVRRESLDRSYVLRRSVGYMDPEYILRGRVTVKSDVYSFGVVLLELMTGLRAVDVKRPTEQIILALWLGPILSQEGDQLKDVMDSTMEGQYSSKAMLLMAQLASECIDIVEDRPCMGKVLQKLQQIYAITEKDNR